jgi:hypothetical protein
VSQLWHLDHFEALTLQRQDLRNVATFLFLVSKRQQPSDAIRARRSVDDGESGRTMRGGRRMAGRHSISGLIGLEDRA